MRVFLSVYKREIRGYFATPLAYLFLFFFLALAGFLTFQDGFFEIRQASLRVFFSNLPLLFLFFVPAISMRLWAEERRSNSIELLFSLPVTTAQAVLGKFFAAWTILALALALTFPIVLTVTYLGDPDWGPIVTGYLGSLLLAGTYLAIGSFFSAITRSQVIAFILGMVACGVFLYAGSPRVMDLVAGFMPQGFIEALESLSFESRFEAIQRGVLELRDLAFFVLLAAGWMWANMVVLEERKAA